MANVVVVGSQWGDEGKGKIVDWLSERADVVVRFQGGHNAGHTLVVDGVTFKLSLLPSGVVRPGKLSVIGNGVVVDPWAFVEEVEKLKAQGVAITPETLVIAENAALILPLHRELDVTREFGERHAGDRHHAARHRPGLRGQGRPPRDPRRRSRRSGEPAGQARPAACPSQRAQARQRRGGGRRRRAPCRAEGDRAEGSALHGLGLAAARRGAPRRQAHPFRGRAGRAPRRRPRHLSVRDLLQHRRRAGGDGLRARRALRRLRARHHQGLHDARRGGAVPDRGQGRDRRAARPRRQGVRDRDRPQAPLRLVRRDARPPGGEDLRNRRHRADQARRSRRPGDDQDRRRLPTRRAKIDYLPVAQGDQARVEPVYEEMEGWQESTAGARSWAELPAQAVKYVRHIEELVQAPVALLSTSPERDDTILVRDPFQD